MAKFDISQYKKILKEICKTRMHENDILEKILSIKKIDNVPRKDLNLVRFTPLRLCKDRNLEIKKQDYDTLSKIGDNDDNVDMVVAFNDYINKSAVCKPLLKSIHNNQKGSYQGFLKHLQESSERNSKTANTNEKNLDNAVIKYYDDTFGRHAKDELDKILCNEKSVERIIKVAIEVYESNSFKGGKRKPAKKTVKRTPAKKTVKRTPAKKTVKRTPAKKTVKRTPAKKCTKK